MKLTIEDATIDVEERGDGAAVVLLHGFPLTRAIWDEQFDALSRACRAIRLDLRGCGASSSPPGPYLMESLAADVAGVLDALGVERATLVGHSLGGYVALAFARMYAERVERLALVCSTLAADSPERARERHALADLIERDGSIEPAIEEYLPKLLAKHSYAQSPKLVERVRAIARENGASGAAALLRGMAMRLDCGDIAGDLDVPVLVVAGAHDRAVPLERARVDAATFPRAQLAVCERSGHLPMLEEATRTVALLVAFCC